MDNKKNGIPKLRFPGFTGAWEQRKLGEVLKERKERSSIGELISVTINNGVVKADSLERKDNSSSDKSNYKVVCKGDIAYNSMRMWQGASGYSPYNGILSPAYTVLIPTEKVDPKFISYMFKKEKMLQQFQKYSQGLTSDTWNLKYPMLKDIPVLFPKIDEQVSIRKHLDNISSLVALHQRKLEHLQEQKKGLLQKMFPKNGETVPEVRFPGFTDAWEQRKLGEITSHRGGTAIEKYFDENGKYKVISIGSYGLNSKYVDQNIRAKSNEITNERVVHAGELTMVLNDKTANGTIIGRSLLIENDNEYVINQRTEIITPKENFNNKFAYTLLNGPFRNKVRRIVQGGTQIYVNYSSVEKLTLFLPNIKEQEKIGKFFNQLDSLIALHQRKLEHLELMKKGLLQQMFV